MLKGLTNHFKRNNSERRGRSGSVFYSENVASPANPLRGHRDAALLRDSIGQTTDFFNNQVMQAGLHQMTIALDIWKAGEVDEADAETLKVPASRFLEAGKDADKVHNYSFKFFIATFQ